MRWFGDIALLVTAVGFMSGQSGIEAKSTPGAPSNKNGGVQGSGQGKKDPSQIDWEAYKARFKKNYQNSVEDDIRRQLRASRLLKIQEHNDAANRGSSSFKLGENAFTDWTPEQYQRLLGLRLPARATAILYRQRRAIPDVPIYYNTISVNTLPTTVNWTASGLVGPIYDQGNCGSCWAYASTGALAAQYRKKTNTWVNLSEQNLIDCSFDQGNLGCDGGNMDYAFWFVQTNGINSLASYPVTSATTGVNGPCLFSPTNIVTSLTSWNNVNFYDEKALQQAVAKVGPVAICMNAGLESFQYYSSGVYAPAICDPEAVNHAVLIVGYGVSAGQPYWLIKNSWGTSWGMNGYMMLARNKNNMCGVATYATFPLI